jgi:hypothetical protein
MQQSKDGYVVSELLLRQSRVGGGKVRGVGRRGSAFLTFRLYNIFSYADYARKRIFVSL